MSRPNQTTVRNLQAAAVATGADVSVAYEVNALDSRYSCYTLRNEFRNTFRFATARAVRAELAIIRTSVRA